MPRVSHVGGAGLARNDRSWAARRARSAKNTAQGGTYSKFATFGEILLVGVVIALCAIPLVTLVPALTAGVRHLDRTISGKANYWSQFRSEFVAALKTGWIVSVLILVAGFITGLNLWAVQTGVLPLGGLVAVVTIVVFTALAVWVLRACGLWAPGQTWKQTLNLSLDNAIADLSGTAYLAAALLMVAAMVWMLSALVIVIFGLLAFASLSVCRKYARNSSGD